MWSRMSCVWMCLSTSALLGAMPLDDQSEAKSVLQRASKAMGDAAKLAKFQTGVAKGKVSGETGGQEISATFEGSWRGLDRYRIEAEISHGNQSASAVIIINGDHAWAKFDGKDDDPPAEVASAIKNALHALRVPQLLMFLTDAAYKVSPTGEVKVGDRPTHGLTVSHKDYKDLTVYFDKESGLPVKPEVRVTVGEGREVPLEFLYSDYKDFDGVKQPGKITIKVEDRETKEFTMLIEHVTAGKQLPDSSFEKP